MYTWYCSAEQGSLSWSSNAGTKKLQTNNYRHKCETVMICAILCTMSMLSIKEVDSLGLLLQHFLICVFYEVLFPHWVFFFLLHCLVYVYIFNSWVLRRMGVYL